MVLIKLPLRCLCLALMAALALPLLAQDIEPVMAPAIRSLTEVFTDPDDSITVSLDQGVVVLSGQWGDDGTPQALLDALGNQPGVLAVRDITSVSLVSSGLEPAVTRFESLLASLLAYLPLVGAALIIIGLFWLLTKVVSLTDPLLARIVKNPWIRGLVLQVLRLVIIIIGMVLALETLNATALVGSILGAAGIVGIAVGFAFRDLIENYIASLMLGIRQPFRPGDHVDIEGREGIVSRLTTRSTIIMTFDGNRMRIPNNQVFKSTITNFSVHPRRRFAFQLGVGYDVDLVKAVNLGVEILLAVDGVLDDPAPSGRVTELGDSTVILKFMVWVDQEQADFGRVRSESLIRVKQAFEDQQLDMPEPTYNLRITSNEQVQQPKPSATEGKPASPRASTDSLRKEESSEAEFARAQAALEAENADDNLIDADAAQEQLDG